MGAKRPTVNDVAREAGVSNATVSRAMSRPNDVKAETRDHIFSVMKRLGYRANQAAADLRRGHSKTLLVLVSDITNPFFSEFFKGIEEEARAHGYVLLIGDTSEDADAERAFSDMLLMNQAAGLILNTNGFLEDLLPSEAEEGTYLGPPVVSCGGYKDLELPTVRTDDVLGGRLAAQHLIDLGHRDATQVCGPMRISGFERRYRGFNDAFTDHAVPRTGFRDIEGPLSVKFGIEAAQSIVASGDLPSAIFVHNDETATGLLHGLVQAGVQVPHDVSVIGYDDMPFAAVFNPGLSSVRLPRREWGRLACAKLIALLNGQTEANAPIIIPPTLIARASTATPKR